MDGWLTAWMPSDPAPSVLTTAISGRMDLGGDER